MPPIDDVDRAILNRIQSDFPMTKRPFLSIAENLDLSESDVIKRLEQLKKKGIIRRIGGNFVPEKLGFVSTLCAAKVPEDKIEGFTRTVNRYPGVTHNYQRDNKYNIWFTFIAQSMDEIKGNLEDISRDTGVKEIINLPATKMYKIRAHFDL
ncbi:MAG: AsnC family transcriptional regulator [Deltaproteobacteria bacterium]|jgi:DNA-binding Lrp family transcriptional regulator|nr:AsnC family transcriptional regulator [Deltaproteobacteria bacterium]MBW1827259.1 AsnC family transcriptional regulator [Deltaproteobacteria bacterium]MBW1969388.1 AsnC family transcriptional regulator [Deltaproteobacteria bacterium]MBW2156885.1 AsnC family transcriptional regulator [Deltaproteobacteria bacterium]MBW2198577.1 AsnC family transcriptional regulator [Deltaproteobacteria bacterium]